MYDISTEMAALTKSAGGGSSASLGETLALFR